MEWFLDEPPGSVRQHGLDDARRIGRAAAACPSCRANGWSACCSTCSTRRSFCRLTASAASRDIIWNIPISLQIDGHRVPRRLRARRNPPRRLFGGNSNWRGPVWFPVNYLLIESLQKFHHYFGDDFHGGVPDWLRPMDQPGEVAAELSRRLTQIFLRGRCRAAVPFTAATEKFQQRPSFPRPLLFYEYFHGDNGAGIGASHQTGWTGLVAKLLQQSGT